MFFTLSRPILTLSNLKVGDVDKVKMETHSCLLPFRRCPATTHRLYTKVHNYAWLIARRSVLQMYQSNIKFKRKSQPITTPSLISIIHLCMQDGTSTYCIVYYSFHKTQKSLNLTVASCTSSTRIKFCIVYVSYRKTKLEKKNAAPGPAIPKIKCNFGHIYASRRTCTRNKSNTVYDFFFPSPIINDVDDMYTT